MVMDLRVWIDLGSIRVHAGRAKGVRGVKGEKTAYLRPNKDKLAANIAWILCAAVGPAFTWKKNHNVTGPLPT
eukprot:764903-Hanusia_phi.AAC.3